MFSRQCFYYRFLVLASSGLNGIVAKYIPCSCTCMLTYMITHTSWTHKRASIVVRTHMHVHIHTPCSPISTLYTHTCAHTRVYTHKRIHAHINTRTHQHQRIHVHTHTHTQIKQDMKQQDPSDSNGPSLLRLTGTKRKHHDEVSSCPTGQNTGVKKNLFMDPNS